MILGPERRAVVFLLLLIVATCAVYSNTLHNAYQLDDAYRIVDNPELERVWPPWRHFFDARTSSTLYTLTQYRPLLPLSLSVNHWISDTLGADRLVALHVGNITIHATTTMLLFLVFCRLLALAEPTSVFSESRRRLTAFFAALVWAVHPVSGIPVNYLSARDLLMMQLFLVAALLVWLRLRLDGETVMRLLGFSVLAALSVLSKETGVALVPLILLLELLLLRDRPFGRSLRWWIGAWIGLSAVYLLIQAKKVAGWLSPDYAWIQLEVHLGYLRNVFWPFKARLLAHVDPPKMPFDLVALAGAAVIVASLYLAWRWRRSLSLYSFCITGYWALLAPSSSVLTLSEPANDYRPYPALACLFLLLVSLLFARLPKRPAVLLAAGAVVYFGVSGFVMNRIWITSERLYSHIVRHGGTALAHLNLARQLKDPAEAEYHYRKALKLEPHNIYAQINLGLLLIRVGRTDEGVALVERGVELQPQRAMSHYWMSRTYEWVRRPDEALKAARRAVEIDSRNASYLYQLVTTLQLNGEFTKSLKQVERLGRLAPDYQRATFHEALALQALGRWEEAAARYTAFLERNPSDALTIYNLAYGRMRQGDHAAAIDGFRRVIELDTKMAAAAHRWLSECYAAMGDAETARYHAARGASPWLPGFAIDNLPAGS